MDEVQKKIWVFPSCEVTRIACHAAGAARIAYYAARRRIEALGGQYSCSLTMGVLDGPSILVFAWVPGVDERLPAIVDAIAVLVGGSALLQEEAPYIDPNTLWWTLRETLRVLHANPDDTQQRGRGVELLELLAQWLRHGGNPPQV
jgi:hypothetical protein